VASSIASAPERRASAPLRARARWLAALVIGVAVAWGLPATAEPAAAPGAPPPAAPPPPAAADLSSLLAGMRSATGVVAKFTETKELALLSSPLQAAGAIYFLPPDRLVREVTSPGRSRLVVDGDRVRFEDETGSKAMDLSGSPIARQLIDSFVVLFNGDEKRLKELYEATFSAEGSAWKLHLVPRSMPLSRMVASFDLAGSGARIDRMEAVEPDGDRTVTVFGETELHHRFGEDELAQLFGAPEK
jgi:outer membrane lipoprotein-sorting protein